MADTRHRVRRGIESGQLPKGTGRAGGRVEPVHAANFVIAAMQNFEDARWIAEKVEAYARLEKGFERRVPRRQALLLRPSNFRDALTDIIAEAMKEAGRERVLNAVETISVWRGWNAYGAEIAWRDGTTSEFARETPQPAPEPYPMVVQSSLPGGAIVEIADLLAGRSVPEAAD